ncbi:MAG: Gfo/Idh/MocA family oxidoreductase [Polyangiaceae bacterium]|nr:Gfo/Idh/MocA family oxidoreductase [Polyangiaceae bacterium]
MNRPNEPKKIRVGVIGASPNWGWAIHAHMPALAALPQYEVTAVSTTRKESAEETAKRFGVAHAFDDANLLVKHPEVDLVVVSVKAPLHAPLVRAAVEARKHVFCEWPLGVSLGETSELAAAADTAGVKTVIGLQRRFAPGVLYLRDLVAESYVGKVRSVAVRVGFPGLGASRPAQYAYTADEKNGVGALATVAAHFLDIVVAALGDISTVSSVVARQFDDTTLIGTEEKIPVTAPDQVVIAGTLANGGVLSAHFEVGKRNGPIIECSITGSEGDLVLGADLTLKGARGEGQPLEPLAIPARYHWVEKGNLSDDAHQTAHLYAAFAEDLAEGTSLAPTFRDATSLHKLLAAIASSSTSGTRQNWAA